MDEVSGRKAQWAEVLELTAQMHTKAQDADWTAVTELEAHRRQCLETFFSVPVAPEDAEMVAKGIEAILAVDKQVIAGGEAERQKVADRLQDIAKGRRGMAAYSDQF